jgi:hypothetical protein
MGYRWAPYAFPEERWELPERVDIRDSGGPDRVVTDQPDPEFMPRQVGFTAPICEVEPLVWEGDGA